MNGILVVNKPSGPTSRDAVNAIQRVLPRKTKIGHAGTLDPLASGVLLIAVGQATRLIEYLQDMSKTYRAVIEFGATSDTDDAAGTITPTPGFQYIECAKIEDYLVDFIGVIDQTPPSYSAVKIDGRRAHDLARKQQDFEIRPRPVRVDSIDMLSFNNPGTFECRIHCGKGTYIRSIARDLGSKLGCGGYIRELVRESIGPFDLAAAIHPEAARDVIVKSIQPMAKAVEQLPNIIVDQKTIDLLNNGQFIPQPGEADYEELAMFAEAGELVGIGCRKGEVLRPEKVFKK